MKKRLISLVLICVLAFTAIPLQASDCMQSYINLMMGADQSQLNVTWYSDGEEANIVWCKSSDVTDGVMPESAMSAEAETEMADEGEGYYSCKAIVTGLEPATEYAYRLVNNGYQSEIRYFTTGDSDEYGFALVGDAQLGSGKLEDDTAAWQHTLDLIENDRVFESADFILSLGDQVDGYSEEHFDAFLNRELIAKMPIATIIGNHETDASVYSYHFNPANMSDKYGVTGAGGDSYFRYNDTLFLLFNTSAGAYDDHKEFVEEAITQNPDVRWRVAVFHHSVYTVSERAEDSSTLSRREWMTRLLTEYGFDIALSGHDHIYSRTYLMNGMEAMKDASYYDDETLSSATDTDGIPYFTFGSSTGSKYYAVEHPDVPEIYIYNQEYTPHVTMVSVTDSSFTLTTYRTTDMSVVDSFTLNKSPEKTEMPFTDVKDSHWYYNAVEYAFTKGMMSGMTETTFGPNVATNRAMLVSVLWRYEGSPEGFTHSFTDVKESHYFDKAVAWASSNGIVAGKSADKYAPNDKLTREQMAAILYRYAAYKGTDTKAEGDLSGFADLNKLSSYALDAMKWAYGKGIITGMTETTLDPRGNATRAQLASILMRFLG
ncbi:MAG: S-layer homology domain-containing protein [Clostridia bacterium]|nr:S-layer homology domain-containing protein [Clostridia bacterium]